MAIMGMRVYTTLGECAQAEVRIRVMCLDCFHFAEFAVETFGQRQGACATVRNMTFKQAEKKFKCSRCNSRNCKVETVSRQPDGPSWVQRYGPKGR